MCLVARASTYQRAALSLYFYGRYSVGEAAMVLNLSPRETDQLLFSALFELTTAEQR